MGVEADYREPTDGAKRAIALAFAAIVVAGLGWADAYEKGHTLTSYKAALTTAGLDATDVGSLNRTIAVKKSALTEAENGLVAATAAANHRARQLETLTTRTAAVEARADALARQIERFGVDARTVESVSAGIAAKNRQLVDVENALVATTAAQSFRSAQLGMLAEKADTMAGRLAEAGATAERLEAENRVLGPKVTAFQNEVVAAEAAARVRQAELTGLIAEVEKNRALVAEAANWAANNKALTQKSETLGRQVVDLENRVVSLAAAVTYRQNEVSRTMVAMNDADSERQTAKLETLAYRAEARKLTTEIGALVDQRKQVEALLVDVNNRFVPAMAAVKAREVQLDKLVKDVASAEATFETLSGQNQTMQARLQETDERLFALAAAAHTAAQHLAEIDKLFEKPTVQAALTQD